MLKKIALFILLVSTFTSCNNSEDAGREQQADIITLYNNSPLVYVSKSIFPTLGNPEAKAHFDIFFDPWCGPCRYTDMQIFNILEDKEYADKVSFSFYLFPLGKTEPNDREGSLLQIEMAKRNLFAKFRERTVKEQVADYNTMLKLAEEMSGTKLPLDLLEKNNAKDLEEAQKLAQYLHLGHTPTVFLNQKEVPITPSTDNFKKLIDYINQK